MLFDLWQTFDIYNGWSEGKEGNRCLAAVKKRLGGDLKCTIQARVVGGSYYTSKAYIYMVSVQVVILDKLLWSAQELKSRNQIDHVG